MANGFSRGIIIIFYIETKSCLREVTAHTSDRILSPELTATKTPLESLLGAKEYQFLQKLALANISQSESQTLLPFLCPHPPC